MPTPIIHITHYHAPCGELLLGAYAGQLCLCDWQTEKSRKFIIRRLQRELKAGINFLDNELQREEHKDEGFSSRERADIMVLQEAKCQLDEYFLGERKEFDLPQLLLGTDFQKRVWEALRHISYGTTVSYMELATRIGQPKAIRAVANANRLNAISIILPCHRVIGSNGSLIGYGGGINIKQYLLNLERTTLFG